MYCRNCGNEIAEGSRFCNHCGTPVETTPQPESIKPDLHNEPEPVVVAEVPRRRVFEEFNWNTGDYPDRNVIEKTEDIDFNWNARPEDIPDTPARSTTSEWQPEPAAHGISVGETLRGEDFEREAFGQLPQQQPERRPEDMSAAERIDKFYTFNRKNEEFQRLINSEYERVKSGNAIEHEMSEADRNAAELFQSRPADTSMDAFFEREGVVKPYQPKEFQSDVLQKIEAQEAEREAKRLEEEARLAAIEEARQEAEAKKRAEEEEARRKAEEEAARLAEIARKQAEEEARAAEEARRREAEEAKQRAEEEARRRVEEEARQRAEAEARVKAAEEARLRAEADLRAAQEAAKIRAQQEARLAAQAEAQFKAEQERKRLEAEEAQRQLEAKRMKISLEANQVVAQEEVRKVLEQTARMQAEEQAKIRAAVAGLRGSVQEPEINKDVQEAHEATRNQINEMAKARDAYFADFDVEEAVEQEETMQESLVTGRNTMLSSSDEIAKTRVIDKKAIAAGLNEATRVASVKPAPAPADDDEFFSSLEAAAPLEEPPVEEAPELAGIAGHEPQPMDFREEAAGDMDDLLNQFAAVNDFEEPEQEKPGLDNTVFMPQDEEMNRFPTNDFDSYGNAEAAAYMNQQLASEQQMPYQPEQQQEQIQYNGGFQQKAADDFYGDDFADDDDEQLSKKERKQREKEQKRLEKERAKEEKAARKEAKREYIEEDEIEEEKSGKGGVVLKVILTLLIIVLVVEVVGMGISFLAPQSKAAEFIDVQLTKVLQLISGDDETEYAVGDPASVQAAEEAAQEEGVPAEEAPVE